MKARFSSLLIAFGVTSPALASEYSYFCYQHEVDGLGIDVNPSIGKLCQHGGGSDQTCASPTSEVFNLTRIESGNDNSLTMGFVGYFAMKSESFVYIRVYAKPFRIGTTGNLELVYKAVSVGTVFDRDSYPDMTSPVKESDFICTKIK
jgi:hypothetical protein